MFFTDGEKENNELVWHIGKLLTLFYNVVLKVQGKEVILKGIGWTTEQSSIQTL